MSAKVIFELEKFLDCPVCLEQCDDPRVLPCLHSLCRNCLQTHVTSSAKDNQFECPACRRVCLLPAGGVVALPKNFLLNSLRGLLNESQGEAAASSTGQKEPTCHNSRKGNIEHTAPTVFCVDCTQFYCSKCEDFHKMFDATSDHCLVPAGKAEIDPKNITSVGCQKTKPRCDQHQNQSLDIYCDTCHVPVCSTCCHLTHREHDHRELVDVATESKSNIEVLTQRARRTRGRLSEHLQKLESTEKGIGRDGEEVCQQIREAADEVRDLITKQEQSMIQTILDSQQTAVSDVGASYKVTELSMSALDSILSYMLVLQRSGDVIDLVTHTPGLQQQLQQLESAPPQEVNWTIELQRESQSVSALNAMLGTVKVDTSVVASGMGNLIGEPLLILKPDFKIRVSGLVVVGDCVYATGDENPYIWVHNMKANTSKLHTIANMAAVGMTVVPNKDKETDKSTLVITDKKRQLHLATICPGDMGITDHTVRPIPFKPCRISADSRTGKLIVANDTDKQIVICDNEGNVEDSVTVKTTIETLKCALVTDDGFVVIDQSESGRVHWVTKNGDVTHTYGQRDGEQLKCPDHMTFDRDGRLIVSDWGNDRLHLIDTNKRLLDYVASRKNDSPLSLSTADFFSSPRCVCIDETTQRLFIGNYDVSLAKLALTMYSFSLYKGTKPLIMVYKWPHDAYVPGTHHTLGIRLDKYE